MKTKILLSFIALLTFFNSHAQLTHFLPRQNAYMSVNNKQFVFDGDTIINNLRYTKVLIRFCTSEIECGDPEYYGAVREDTINGKYFGIQALYDVEHLLADFNVEAGSMVNVYCYWPSPEYPYERIVEVESIDYVEINGESRKRVNLVKEYNLYEWDDYWIEGLGSIHGLFYPAPEAIIDITDTPVLLCLHIDDVLIWQNPMYDLCYLYYGVNISNNKSTEFGIYPSIIKDRIYIKKDNGCYIYNIFNMQGLFVQSGTVTDTIELSTLLQGNYLIVFYDKNDKFIYSGKFIKR